MTCLPSSEGSRTASASARPRRPASARTSADAAFTLPELLVVVGIIVVLVGLLVPTIALVRRSSAMAATRSTVSLVAMALTAYRQEDRRQAFPVEEAGGGLTASATGDSPGAVLDLLAGSGFAAGSEALVREEDGTRRLIDAWRRPIRYRVDRDGDGTADRPAALDDWNPAGIEPYAYVWSIGPRRVDDAADALPADAAGNWIYRTGGR